MRKSAYILMLLVLLAGVALAEHSMDNVSKSQASAMGKVDVGGDRNGNTDVYIRTWHLAKPDSLNKTAYVVWFQPKDGAAQNMGVLKSDEDLKGAFRTTTALKKFDVVITLEGDPHAQVPTGEEILRTAVER